MPHYLLLMHDDAAAPEREASPDAWKRYLDDLRASGSFEGGSAIGDGVCARKYGPAPPVTAHLTGYLRIAAANLEEARRFLTGNPVFEAGGTVEIRELPRTD